MPSHPFRTCIVLVLISAACALGLGAVQSYLTWGDAGLDSRNLWPNILPFLLPAILISCTYYVTVALLLPGPERLFARGSAWTALGARILCLALMPVALMSWGKESDRSREGLLFNDARIAGHAAWDLSRASDSAANLFLLDSPSSTEEPVILGAWIYRAFSPDQERPLILGLAAAFVSAFIVPLTYLLGERFFSPAVAKAGALIAALYPDAVLYGSAFLTITFLSAAISMLLYLSHQTISRYSAAFAEFRLSSVLPRLAAGTGILLAVALFFPAAYGFIFLAIVGYALFWFSDPHQSIGRLVRYGIGILLAVWLLVSLLASLHVLPPQMDLLGSQAVWLFGSAIRSSSVQASAESADVFETLLRAVPYPLSMVVMGAYGLIQPILPAAIGAKPDPAPGGTLWYILGLVHAAGWYLALPFLGYATLQAARKIHSGRPERLLVILFWAIVLAAAYRGQADQWENPGFRILGLLPMALLMPLAWTQYRSDRDVWWGRLLAPYLTGIGALTTWYVLRSYAGLRIPSMIALAAVAGLTLLAFVLALAFVRNQNQPTWLEIS